MCRGRGRAAPPPRVLRHLGKLGEAALERAVLPEAGGYCVDAWLEHRRVAVLVADRPAFCQTTGGATPPQIQVLNDVSPCCAPTHAHTVLRECPRQAHPCAQLRK